MFYTHLLLSFSILRSSGQQLQQARAVVLPLPSFHRAVIFAKTLYIGVAIHGLFMIGQKMVKKSEWLHGGGDDGANEKILPLMCCYLIPSSGTRCKLCKYSFIRPDFLFFWQNYLEPRKPQWGNTTIYRSALLSIRFYKSILGCARLTSTWWRICNHQVLPCF